jgi:hypothetical protein
MHQPDVEAPCIADVLFALHFPLYFEATMVCVLFFLSLEAMEELSLRSVGLRGHGSQRMLKQEFVLIFDKQVLDWLLNLVLAVKLPNHRRMC